jgi:plastocyanin
MRSRTLAAAMFALAAWGCGGGGSSSSASPSAPTPTASGTAPAGAITVTIMGQRNDQSFSPNPAPIVQGSLVVWRNTDTTVHRIVMNDGSFDSGDIGPGTMSAAMKLSSGGGQYHCTIHPTTMFGSINTATTGDPGTGMPGSGYPYR